MMSFHNHLFLKALQDGRFWEKGGKEREIPVPHDLEAWLRDTFRRLESRMTLARPLFRE